ncbi:MAG: YifB family Mg chelatase-like AAA ATPase [Roseburia sp.]
MYSIVSTAMIHGIKSIPISVEADVSDGMPMFAMVGFLASEVREASERVRTALRNLGYPLPAKRITVNLTPANIRKSGSGFDLPVSLAVLSALGSIPAAALEEYLVIGEIGLNGKIQPVRGVLPMVAGAKEQGLSACILPKQNEREAALIPGMRVYGVENVREAVELLQGQTKEPLETLYNIEETESKTEPVDFADIHGQKLVKRACEIAVSGMHNLLMVGPPGAGKTMTAMRIPTILPPLDETEQMELSQIYSVSGLFEAEKHLMRERPFRCPHHTVSAQRLAGGGAVPRPGEISLAHKGVLFLDELPEFQKETLEILRQPMEEKKIRLGRITGEYEFPADFILVAAMNPCKCGYYPDMQKCRCTGASIARYIGRISQPLLDRIDICVEAPQIKFSELQGGEAEESSATIRSRVMEAQERQRWRYRNEDFSYNSQVPAAKLAEYCALNEKQQAYMEQVYNRLNLTARSYHKILKVARTLADAQGSERIENRHLNEAVCYRSIDRKFWEGEL